MPPIRTPSTFQSTFCPQVSGNNLSAGVGRAVDNLSATLFASLFPSGKTGCPRIERSSNDCNSTACARYSDIHTTEEEEVFCIKLFSPVFPEPETGPLGRGLTAKVRGVPDSATMPKAKDLTGDLGKLRGRSIGPEQARPLGAMERPLAFDAANAVFWMLLLAAFSMQLVLMGWLALSA